MASPRPPPRASAVADGPTSRFSATVSRVLRNVLPGALLAAGALAQGAEVVLQNLVALPRREVAAVAVPFARGAVKGLPDLHVEGRATAWQPFGARWPDGTLRHALCLFVVDVDKSQELRLPLVPGKGPELPTGAPPLAAGTVEFVVTVGGRTVRTELPAVRELETSPLRRVELRRGRLGDTGLVGELRVTAAHEQPFAYCDVAVFFSDPGTKAMELAVDELAVETTGAAWFCYHAGALAIEQQVTERGSRVVLCRRRTFGDGQGLRRTGALIGPLAHDGSRSDDTKKAASLMPLLGAADWRGSGAFGAFGVVPELPPWLTGEALRAHLALRHRHFLQTSNADPFAVAPLGLAKDASQTGDQYDFGVVKLSLVAASGLPSLLFEAEASVLQEACRPVHFFEPDGSPVDPARHPEWVVWSGRTHWHEGVSPDRLGKPVPVPKSDTNGWTGKDRQHWSSNHLGAYALLTGSHWARAELENEARLFLAGQTIDPQKSTSGVGPPRGAGRTLLAASWAYLATGDETLLARINARLDGPHLSAWTTRERPEEHVRPFSICKPDPRQLSGAGEYWNPWQEALAAVGYAAAHRITGNENARLLAEGLACNVVRHGWRVDERQCMVALAMRWQDGQPILPAQFDDAALVEWPRSSGFAHWALPAVEIARVASLAVGDRELQQRAEEIQRRVRAGRQRPPMRAPEWGGMDRLGEWDAVRWTDY